MNFPKGPSTELLATRNFVIVQVLGKYMSIGYVDP